MTYIIGQYPISSYDTIIYSREVIDRILYLIDNDSITHEGIDELANLKKLSIEGASITDEWDDGVSLIRESYFEEYAREHAVDAYGLSEDDPFANYIDWERWTKDLMLDYSIVNYCDVQYFIRN